MNLTRAIVFLLLSPSIWSLSQAEQTSDTPKMSSLPVEVIIYDEETFRRINGLDRVTPDLQSNPQDTQAVRETSRIDLPTNQAIGHSEISSILSAPVSRRDLSPFYTRRVKDIPVMDNPPACGVAQPEIKLTVYNPSKLKGQIVTDLHNHIEEDFLDSEKVVHRVIVPVSGEETVFCVPVSEPGDYAFAIYHDENSNGKWDKNFLGIPKERFAISNNPTYGMRAPDFEEAVCKVPSTGIEQRIRLTSSSDVMAGNRDK